MAELDDVARLGANQGYVTQEQAATLCRAHYGPVLESAYDTLGRRAAEDAGFAYRDQVVSDVKREGVDHLVSVISAGAAKVLTPFAAVALARGWAIRRTARAMREVVNLTPAQARTLAVTQQQQRADRVPAGEATAALGRLHDRLERARIRGLTAQELWQAGQAVQAAIWNEAMHAGEVSRGRVRKFWVTSGDRAVRDTHSQIPDDYPDGVEIDGSFVTRLGQLRYPCDPRGASEDVIGCRCRLDYRVD